MAAVILGLIGTFIIIFFLYMLIRSITKADVD